VHSNCIKNLLNLKGVILKSINNLENIVEIHIELPVKEHACPCCGTKTTKVHDYYTQPITDIPIQFKPTKIQFNNFFSTNILNISYENANK
jgi:transposase